MSQAFLNGIMIRRRLLAATLAASLAAVTLPALAHHGWDWAQAEQTEMKGTVQKVSMAPPHPSLQVKAADGVVWQVDLSNPGQTERSGFTGASAKPGELHCHPRQQTQRQIQAGDEGGAHHHRRKELRHVSGADRRQEISSADADDRMDRCLAGGITAAGNQAPPISSSMRRTFLG